MPRTWPWRSRVVKASIWSRWCLRFDHNDADSERFLLGSREVSDSAMMMRSRKSFCSAVVTPSIRPWWCRLRRLLLNWAEVSDSAMTMQSQNAFFSAAVTPSIRPWQCRLGKASCNGLPLISWFIYLNYHDHVIIRLGHCISNDSYYIHNFLM